MLDLPLGLARTHRKEKKRAVPPVVAAVAGDVRIRSSVKEKALFLSLPAQRSQGFTSLGCLRFQWKKKNNRWELNGGKRCC
uniref:Uncharacterized protein n=1 Tax=Nelumbo nucifera TaxID=4432 RepID=A0A822Z5X5_NELNU|nr:TPA_asm: hypothetical protein HUJ06_009037 [Nelumbo nucifera]